jgi:predicted neuraminidase
VTQHSNDQGVTWSAATPALDALCTLVRNKPIVLRDGRWLLPAYQEAIYQSQFWITDNQGTNWSALPAVFTFPVSNLQPAVVQLADGSLYALMRNGAAGGPTWQGRSADCGRTWQLSQRADLPNPNSGLDLIRLPDGRLLWAGNPSDSQRTPLAIAFSLDNGMTWSPPRTLERGIPQLSYPSLCRSRNGLIHVSYSHRLTHIRHVEFNVAWLESAGSRDTD